MGFDVFILFFSRSVYICLSNKTRYILWASFHRDLSTSGRISLFHSLMVGYSHTFNVGVSLQVFYVSFNPFFVYGFWSLFVTKLGKYENITWSLFTFCKARWARRKKPERKSCNLSDQNTKNQMTKVFPYFLDWYLTWI